MSAPLEYAVFGHPIAHSRSPWIHARFAQDCGIAMRYGRIDSPPESFHEALFDFAEAGGRGANITLPLKELAAAACDELSERAARAGAVNTLIALPDRRWRGDNTDGLGLMADLKRLGISVQNARVLILGAGGSVRGILAPLMESNPACVVIANRSVERAAALRAEFCTLGRIEALACASLDALAPVALVIHATSAYRGAASMCLPRSIFVGRPAVYDLSYGAAADAFLSAAAALGAGETHDGLGMLVEQAAESFARWHGMRPETATILAELRERLAADP